MGEKARHIILRFSLSRTSWEGISGCEKILRLSADFALKAIKNKAQVKMNIRIIKSLKKWYQ